MSKAYILFNGIQYPFEVVEAAISYASRSNSSLEALFLRSDKSSDEGYLFPSDLDAAEDLTSNDEASERHAAVIESNMRMLRNEAARHHVSVGIKTFIEPDEDQLL